MFFLKLICEKKSPRRGVFKFVYDCNICFLKKGATKGCCLLFLRKQFFGKNKVIVRAPSQCRLLRIVFVPQSLLPMCHPITVLRNKSILEFWSGFVVCGEACLPRRLQRTVADNPSSQHKNSGYLFFLFFFQRFWSFFTPKKFA